MVLVIEKRMSVLCSAHLTIFGIVVARMSGGEWAPARPLERIQTGDYAADATPQMFADRAEVHMQDFLPSAPSYLERSNSPLDGAVPTGPAMLSRTNSPIDGITPSQDRCVASQHRMALHACEIMLHIDHGAPASSFVCRFTQHFVCQSGR